MSVSESTSRPPAPADANAHCAEITKHAAGNFYYGIRLLPEDKRAAMCAIYAFARRIDDIGDSGLPPQQSLLELDREQEGLAALQRGAVGVAQAADPVIVALADANRRFALPLDALVDLIEGVRMDALDSSYETFEQLELYCRRVAGSIGRLSLAVFGAAERERAYRLADDLGVAMQLTNILRDVREDAERGRVYLPGSELRHYHLRDTEALGATELLRLAGEAGHAGPDALLGIDDGEVGQLFALMRFQSLRARDWFARGLELLPLLDRRSAACVGAMSGIYRRLLVRIEARPDIALSQRMSLPAYEKARVAMRSLLVPPRARRGL